MARQKFEKGQRVVTCSWGNQWKEATVIEPQVIRTSFGSFKEQAWVVVSYPPDDRSVEVLNNRRHILSMEEYAPIAEDTRRRAEARRQGRDLAERRREARYEFHAKEISDIVTGRSRHRTWGDVWAEIAAYLKRNFHEQRMVGTNKGPADAYAEEQVPE